MIAFLCYSLDQIVDTLIYNFEMEMEIDAEDDAMTFTGTKFNLNIP